MVLTIERLTERDIPQVVALSASVGWDDTPEDVQTALAVGEFFGHKTADGRLLSCAAICVYGQAELASLGTVIVHPTQQGRGLGRAVVQACLSSAQTGIPVRLAATDQGAPLYERLGFRRVGTLDKVICDQYIPQHPDEPGRNWDLSRLSGEQFDRIVELDAKAVGAERGRLLAARVRQAKEGVVLTGTDGSIIGFGLSVQGPENLLIGPVVAPNDHLALALVDRLAQGHKGKLRMDIPSQHQGLLTGLADRGFRTVKRPPVMMLNADAVRGDQTLFGIASQAFG